MNVEIAELALLVMLRRTVKREDFILTERATGIAAADWRAAQRRVLSSLNDQIAFKSKLIQPEKR